MRAVRHALRQLAGSPGFTATAVITLALGIGLNTAMFSVLNTFLLRPLPYAEPHRLFQLDRASGSQQGLGHKAPNYFAIVEQSGSVAEFAGFMSWGFVVSGGGHPAEMRNALRVSSPFLDVLGVKPAIGRNFRPDEDAPGRNRVVILSDAYWRSRFDGDRNVIGQVVRIGGEPSEIVGVLPASAGDPGVIGGIDLLRPMALDGDERTFNTETLLRIVGRYRPGIAPGTAQAHFDLVASRLAGAPPPENASMALRAVSLPSTRLDGEGVTLTMLLVGLSGFVLLIACANLANLLVARAVSRSREFAIRSALGASSSQLIRQLALECLVLAAAGGALGILLCQWTTRWMAAQLSGDGPRLDMPQDWRVLGFAAGAALLTACLFGIAPAWFVSRVRVNDTLKSGARGSTVDRSQHRVRNVLLVGQFALALVLLAGAVAFARGINGMLAREAGWTPAVLVTAKIGIPETLCRADPDCTLRFHRQLRDRLAALPGVESASVDIDLPLFGFPGPRPYVIDGRPPPAPGQEPHAYTNAVSPEYFDTVGTPILAGRGILTTDTRESGPVVVINETMARELFPDGALGRRIRPLSGAAGSDPLPAEIVGIARDVRFLFTPAQATKFQVYKPLAEETWGYVSLTVRAQNGRSAAALVEPFRRVVAEVDPDVPAIGLMPVPAVIDRALTGLATINQLLVAFAGLGLFLAALGVYGVMARLVTQRTLEIGIRMALGASFRDIVRVVLGSGLRTTLSGAGLGLLGAAALTRLLNVQFPDMASNSAITVGFAALVLLATSLVACYLPARRAARVDPLIALRAE